VEVTTTDLAVVTGGSPAGENMGLLWRSMSPWAGRIQNHFVAVWILPSSGLLLLRSSDLLLRRLLFGGIREMFLLRLGPAPGAAGPLLTMHHLALVGGG
jgi:hypothetical protein